MLLGTDQQLGNTVVDLVRRLAAFLVVLLARRDIDHRGQESRLPIPRQTGDEALQPERGPISMLPLPFVVAGGGLAPPTRLTVPFQPRALVQGSQYPNLLSQQRLRTVVSEEPRQGLVGESYNEIVLVDINALERTLYHGSIARFAFLEGDGH